MKFAITSTLVSLGLVSSPLALAQKPSETERLERLERAVELLQKRNAELEAEVKSLKKEKSPLKTPAPLTDEKRSHFVPDSKSAVVDKTETVEQGTRASIPDKLSTTIINPFGAA